jgi:hypothetical protein
MTTEEKLKVLNSAGPVDVQQFDGEWLCKHTDAMVQNGNTIAAYFMYMPTREIAIDNYFAFVTRPGTVILLMPAFTEFAFDGTTFVEVIKN